MRVLGALDPVVAWDGERVRDAASLRPPAVVPPTLRGAAACVLASDDGGTTRLLRDPLGINKLFWATDEHGEVVLASRPHRLVAAGHAFADVRALPRGTVLDAGPAGAGATGSLVPAAWSDGGGDDLAAAARAVGDELDRFLAALAAAHPDARAVVCLSGGLDSSGVAVLARAHFADVVGVSFDLERPGGGESEDRVVARRLARDLGLDLLEVTVTPDALLDALDTVLVEGVDWRDFNVHAGLVNAALAEAIAAQVPGPVLVLTGDLANEFLVDYHEEEHGGSTYYALPRLAPAALRTLLVRGLESSNREVGVFGAWGLPVVQPYAAAADAFLSVPAGLLAVPDAKQRLARAVFGERVPAYVYARTKTRAQVGGAGSGGGVLGVCAERGVDAAALRARFAALHGVADERDLVRFLRTGMHRAGVP